MAQKVNPKIFRIRANKLQWSSKFIEKNREESTLYNYQTVTIESYLKQFLNLNGIITQKIKFYFSTNNIYISISFFTTKRTAIIIKKNRIKGLNLTKIEAIKIKKVIIKLLIRKLKRLQDLMLYLRIIKNPSKLRNTNTLIHKTRKELVILYNRFRLLRKKYVVLKASRKHRKARIPRYFKKFKYKKILRKILKKNIKKKELVLYKKYINWLIYNKYKKKGLLKKNLFVEQILESLSLFTNKKYNIHLNFKHLNSIMCFNLERKKLLSLKRRIFLLKKYKKEKFFKDVINIIFTVIRVKNSSQLLSDCIAKHIKYLKKHNFFLAFLKQILKIFMSLSISRIKGIKILISGRFNGAPRAKHRTITFGSMPIQTIKKQIDYSISTSYTKNGTFGIKLWINYCTIT